MTVTDETVVPLRHADRFFIGGEWVAPSSDATIDVIDSGTEQVYFRVAEARAADMDRAVTAARRAFDEGPWPTLTHTERAGFLRGIAAGLRERADDIGQIWPRESGALHLIARGSAAGTAAAFDYYADLATTFPFEERAQPSMGEFGLLVREPVGVVGAIIPWNAPIGLITYKVAPALLAGCTVVLKCSPEAPGDAYVVAEIAESIGLPAGVLNVVTADREVSELLVRDPPGGQDHIHRVHGRGTAHRIHLRREDRPLHPGAGGQVRRSHPRRHGPGQGSHHAGPGRVHALRPGVLVPDSDHRQPQPP